MEVNLTAPTQGPYTTGNVNEKFSVLKIRPATPKTAQKGANSPDATDLNSQVAADFTHSIQYVGNLDQIDSVQNSVAMKLVRSQRDKQNGQLTLLFDFIFWPSKSFM